MSDEPHARVRTPASSAAQWPPIARFIARENALAAWAGRRRWTFHGYEFIRFGIKQAWACLFGGLMVALLIVTWGFYPPGAPLARYDALTFGGVLIQIVMIATRLETPGEVLVILVFHVVGTAMEIFKTYMGSWIYPEPNLLRIAGVPLFSGFMYAAVGSYIARAWRLFDFRFTHYPPMSLTIVLAIAIYLNFFAHHFIGDARLLLFAGFALLFGRTWIYYRVHRHWRRMPVLVATGLVAFFIWLAENVGTATHAWNYPNQRLGWSMVPFTKLGAWYLLMIISVVLVSLVNRPARWNGASHALSSAPDQATHCDPTNETADETTCRMRPGLVQ